ncbi:MAG: hypothetical protein LLF89_02905 [Spirochaetaceae bacterium]|nr:hypothetical protein [Spirochaetaceae bacterium]
MERVLEVLNKLEAEGVIDRYAIGGAMGAVFYAEPVATYDLDIFVHFAPSPSGLISLSPLYEALACRGYHESGAYVEIEGVSVQFLPAYNALVEEALVAAAAIHYQNVPTRVFRAEHLIAIAVQTGRPKDRGRVAMLRAQAGLDEALLDDILKRYGLVKTWNEWTQ